MCVRRPERHNPIEVMGRRPVHLRATSCRNLARLRAVSMSIDIAEALISSAHYNGFDIVGEVKKMQHAPVVEVAKDREAGLTVEDAEFGNLFAAEGLNRFDRDSIGLGSHRGRIVHVLRAFEHVSQPIRRLIQPSRTTALQPLDPIHFGSRLAKCLQRPDAVLGLWRQHHYAGHVGTASPIRPDPPRMEPEPVEDEKD
jgi:hypothetical protein